MPLTLRKRGKYWHARGTVPAKEADGSIGRTQVEESTRTESKTRAREIAADIERHYHDLAYGRLKEQGPSFSEAATTYIQTRGKSDRFVSKLIGHFKDTPIGELDQATVAKAAHVLYPGAKASTHVRAVWAPVTTILRLNGVYPNFKRPKIERVPIVIPKDDWFDQVLPHCPPKLAALLITLTLRGRRVTELLEIRPEDIDYETGEAVIGRTKNGDPVLLHIPEPALELLQQARPKGYSGRYSKSAFGYANRNNVYRALKQACDRAGILVRDGAGKIVDGYFSTHPAGRHSMATRLLKAGKSLKFVKEAVGWKTIKMPAQHYGHLEKQDVDDEVKRIGQEWGKARETSRKNKKEQ